MQKTRMYEKPEIRMVELEPEASIMIDSDVEIRISDEGDDWA